MSLAFNSDGSRLCVLNGGTVNGVMYVDIPLRDLLLD